MTVEIGMVGRERTFTVGGSTILGVSTKGLTCNSEPVDITNDASSGTTELLAIAGAKSFEYPISGILQNLELFNTFFTSASQMFEIIITFPDGSTVTFDGFMTNISETGESNGAVTFDATFISSGAGVFVAGT